MWETQLSKIDGRTLKGTVSSGSGTLSFREVIDLWCESSGFRSRFTELLKSSPFEGFFWETPPVRAATLDQPFDFVLVDGPPLTRLTPDQSPFSEHFASHGPVQVLTFPNLRGDAVLVVPAPTGDEKAYAHLARFLHSAPEGQIDEFWRCVGVAMRERVSEAPVWLSTAGLGVSWLHLRLDSRPKYYRHQPYKDPG